MKLTWSQAIKETVVSLPKDVPYQWDEEAKGGVTEDLWWKHRRILAAAKPAKVYCCGLVVEIFLKALERFPVAKTIDIDDAREIKRFAFLQPELFEQTVWGLPGYMVSRGWAELITEPSLVKTGDIAQIWFNYPQTLVDNDPSVPGHSIIAYDAPSKLTPFDIIQDKESIWTIGANSTPRPGGIVRDW